MRSPAPLLVALALAPLASVAPALAEEPSDERQEAESRYKRALELFAEGSYDGALLELKRAYELAPTYRILYNIALVNVQLNDYASALDAFERYLAEGGDEVQKARRKEVETEIERLRPRVGFLTVVVAEEGSEVMVDDVSLGSSPLPEHVRVNAGRRKVTVISGDYREDRVIELAGGDELEVTFEAPPPVVDEAAPPPPPPPPPAPPPPPPEREVPWIAWGVTGALFAGAVTTGILALSAHSEQTELKESLGATRAKLDDADSKVQTWAIVTDVLTGATLAAAGVSLYLTLKPPSSSDDGAGQATLVIRPRGVEARVTF
jgi:hypothetical protein